MHAQPPVSAPGALAIANYDFRASGTVAKSIQIAAAARAAGLPAELWVTRARGPLREFVPAGIPVVETGMRTASLGARGADLAASVPALATAVRQRRPAVLLSGGNHFHIAARAALAWSGERDHVRLGLRVSNSSLHGGEPRLRTGGVFTRAKYAGADFVAAVSEELAAEVRAQVPGLEVDCIPNGCDIAAVRRLGSVPFQHPFLDAGGVLVTAMGRVARQKGFDILIRALALLVGDVDARLLILGAGPEARVRALQRLAAQQGVADRVQFTGYLANPFAVIARSQLFVCASRWEGSSNALLEALACGVKVVASDCPTGNRELLLGGRLGELAPRDFPAGLAMAMRRELALRREEAPRAQQLARLELARCMQGWVKLLDREYHASGGAGVLLQRAGS